MTEIVFTAPDIATLVTAATNMGFYDPASKTITAAGSIATGGGYFLNLGETRRGITVPGVPGIWGRLRHNGDPALLPNLPAGTGITVYHDIPGLGWSADGVTPAPAYVATVGVIA